MRNGVTRMAVAALALLAAGRAAAIDAPHDGSSSPGINSGNCSDCHSLHNGQGRGLLNQPDTYALCSSCHNKVAAGGRLGFPWFTQDQAVPGSGGVHHRWDADATNLGARVPATAADAPLAARVNANGGSLACSVCHDQHAANQANAPATAMHTSQPVGAGFNKESGSGTGALALAAVASGAVSKGYLVEIVTAGTNATATFHVSHDNGASWFRCSAATTYSYVAEPAGFPCQAGPSAALDDPAVRVAFNAGATGTSFAAGDRYRFYVSYPFLRAPNASAELCEDCHADRVMQHAAVEGPNAGWTTSYSHPVGEALGGNGKGYDRAGPLDANGAPQATGDANPTNDLHTFGSAATVRCLSCHSPHNADSNSQTTDAR
jgi:predicted CXXCH cytochrome family protein